MVMTDRHQLHLDNGCHRNQWDKNKCSYLPCYYMYPHWNRGCSVFHSGWYWPEVKQMLNKWAMSWENLFTQYVNNKGADQPVHPWRLISTFVVHCLDSIIPLVSIPEISLGAVWSGSTLFSQTCLSENFGSLRYSTLACVTPCAPHFGWKIS